MLAARDLQISVAGRRLLDGVNLALRPGEMHALLGRNGTGKTRLMLTLAGLRRPDRGCVELDGRPIEGLPRLARARRLAILLQDDPEPFWGNTAEYAALGRHPHGGPRPADAARVAAILEELDLANRAGQSYLTLSGGERQRARLARVLAQEAGVLLLDEPLTNLDPAHQGQVLAALARRATAGAALLMSLHEPALALAHCDRAVLLYDPARIEQGPVNDLVTLENLEALYRCRLESSPGFLVPPRH